MLKNTKKVKKIVNLILVALIYSIFMVAFFVLESSAQSYSIVYIPDRALKKAINKEISSYRREDQEVTREELSRVTQIGRLENGYFSPRTAINNVKDVTGLDYATNLEGLFLHTGEVSNLRSIRNLRKLVYLQVENNKLINLDDVSNINTLHMINVNSNAITSIDGVKNLSELAHFFIGYNKIEDLSPISNIKTLRMLGLSGNNIKNISSIAKLTNLTHIWAGSCNISSVEAFRNLKKLSQLYLDNNNIEDLNPLRELKNLWILYLQKNKIKNVKPLAYISNKIGDLRLSENQIMDFRTLVRYKNDQILLENMHSQSQYIKITDNKFQIDNVYNINGEKVDVSIKSEFNQFIKKIGENDSKQIFSISKEGLKKLSRTDYMEILNYNRKTKSSQGYTGICSGKILALKTTTDAFENEISDQKIGSVKIHAKIDIIKSLKNMPEGVKFKIKKDISTDTLGRKKAVVTVIFKDGSQKDINVEVIVNIFDVQINYLNKKEKIVKSEEKEVKIDPEKLI